MIEYNGLCGSILYYVVSCTLLLCSLNRKTSQIDPRARSGLARFFDRSKLVVPNFFGANCLICSPVLFIKLWQKVLY